MINWKVRFKSKTFWIALIPTVLMLIQQVAAVFGIALDFEQLNTQLVAIVGTVFTILALFGIVVDHTTEGIGDSDRALLYDEPYPRDRVM